MNRRGVCRFCRCTELRPCPGGCAWTNERDATLCTQCIEINAAWVAIGPTRRPNMMRPFFYGLVAGAKDPRAIHMPGENPFQDGGDAWAYWNRGCRCGEQLAQRRARHG